MNLERKIKKNRKNQENIENNNTDSKIMEFSEELKREKRLEKNREAAQLFRQRQKAYIEDLEKKVNKVETENAQNLTKVELLKSENKIIKQQLEYLRKFISDAISLSLENNNSFFNNNQCNNSFNNAINNENNNQLNICKACNKPITTVSILNLNSLWHKECFICKKVNI
jgi:hypothetical protein